MCHHGKKANTMCCHGKKTDRICYHRKKKVCAITKKTPKKPGSMYYKKGR